MSDFEDDEALDMLLEFSWDSEMNPENLEWQDVYQTSVHNAANQLLDLQSKLAADMAVMRQWSQMKKDLWVGDMLDGIRDLGLQDLPTWVKTVDQYRAYRQLAIGAFNTTLVS